MNAIIYLLQVSACMAIFYGFYYLLLNRLTFFTINRYYLLFTLVLSFIIPLLTIPVHQQYTAAPVVQQVIQMRSLPTIPNYTFTPIQAPIPTTTPITWMQLLNWGYLAAVAGLSIHLLITLFNFFTKLKLRKISRIGNVHILRGDKKLPNGSFLNYIFLNDDKLSAEEMEQIVAHEMLHVKLFHSSDRILMKLVQIILWFNPLVYFYARSMEENHEFEVDREVARSTDKTKYADLLLHLSVANQGMLYHSFSKVPLKKRIVMLFNQPSAKIKRVVYVLVLPVILLSCLAFGKIKKEDIKIDLVKSGKEILTAIKTGQDNMVAQLNQPIQLPAAILNTDSSTIVKKVINQPESLITTLVNDTIRYSRLGNFAKNAKVTINGKQYPSDILYEMSNSNLTAVSINSTGQNGPQIIDIQTENGQIVYMTPHEKDNLRKERTTPINQFYTRLKLTRENGERYDYVVIRIYNAVSRDAQGQLSHLPGNYHRDMSIGPDDKVGFIINGKFYSEDELETVPVELIASLNRIGSATYRPETLYQNKYKVVFTLSTSDYADPQGGAAERGGGRFGGGGGRSNFNFNNQGTMTTLPILPTNASIDTTRGIKYYNNLGFFQGDSKGSSDTIQYFAPSYKTRPNGTLIELVTNLPNMAVNNQGVFSMNKKLNTLLIDSKPYNGDIMQGLKSLPADIFSYINIYWPGGVIDVFTKKN